MVVNRARDSNLVMRLARIKVHCCASSDDAAVVVAPDANARRIVHKTDNEEHVLDYAKSPR